MSANIEQWDAEHGVLTLADGRRLGYVEVAAVNGGHPGYAMVECGSADADATSADFCFDPETHEWREIGGKTTAASSSAATAANEEAPRVEPPAASITGDGLLSKITGEMDAIRQELAAAIHPGDGSAPAGDGSATA